VVASSLFSRRTVRTLVLIAITAAAAWLRFHAIAAKSFWIDEGASVAIARMDWHNFLRLLWRREANMTLYYVLLRGWIHLGGSEAFIRALSVVFALLTIPVLYLLGKRLFGRRAAMAACVLLAVNAFHIRYSQEARAYTLVVLLVTLASLCFVEAIQRPERWKWSAYAIVAALAVYAQFYAVLVVVAHVAWWWRYERPKTPALTPELRRALIFFLALTAPIWIFIATTGAGPLRWLERPGVHALRDFIADMTGNAGWLLALFYVALVIRAARGERNRDWDEGRDEDRNEEQREPARQQPRVSHASAFALAWLLLPILITLIVSLLRPVFLPRYLIICLPPLTLLAGAALIQLPKLAATAVLIGMTALSLQGTANYYARDFDLLREDWRGATAYVTEHQQPGDAILFHANQGRMPFDYYAQLWNRPEPVIYFPGANRIITWHDFMGSPSLATLNEAAKESRRVWLVLSHTNDADAATKLSTTTLENHLGHPVRTDFAGVEVLLYSR
jgi:mannosyltransferase